jgi:fumarate reductase subunit C
MTVKTYMRPMTGWWRKNPFFVRYMIREASAPLFYLYALWLLAGIVALATGQSAYAGWWAVAKHPLMILANLVVLVFAVYHTWTWFSVLPKTTPDLDVAPTTLITGGVVAAVVACGALFAFVWGVTR